jgi:hypothetical protein
MNNEIRELTPAELDMVSGGDIKGAAVAILNALDNLVGGSKTIEGLINKIDPYARRCGANGIPE